VSAPDLGFRRIRSARPGSSPGARDRVSALVRARGRARRARGPRARRWRLDSDGRPRCAWCSSRAPTRAGSCSTTHGDSRKGRELAANPRPRSPSTGMRSAAVRIEGLTAPISAQESNAYCPSRRWEASRLRADARPSLERAFGSRRSACRPQPSAQASPRRTCGGCGWRRADSRRGVQLAAVEEHAALGEAAAAKRLPTGGSRIGVGLLCRDGRGQPRSAPAPERMQ